MIERSEVGRGLVVERSGVGSGLVMEQGGIARGLFGIVWWLSVMEQVVCGEERSRLDEQFGGDGVRGRLPVCL